MNQPDIFNLLAAPGPFSEYAEKLMLYGQFVGSWDIDATWYASGTPGAPGAQERKGRGEWHFGWVLGGRGVQDVLFAAGSPPEQFGTTLRGYDATHDVWHISWMQPFGGEFVHLVGRKVENNIVQEGFGTDPHRRERWSFTNITHNAFIWLGEVSYDRGATWILEQEMLATRRVPR